MTKNEKKVLTYIRFFWAEEGYSPSLNEISTHMGWKSKSQASYIVKSLIKTGRVKSIPGKYRSIEAINVQQ